MISAKIISILVFAAIFTVWNLFLQDLFMGWMEQQYGNVGIGGGYFVGGVMLSIASMAVSYILIRRLRKVD